VHSLRAVIAYDGTDFSGFQVQRPKGKERALRTVQGSLEDALAQILQKPTPLLAAGRTDSGVHAVGQVIAFSAEWNRPLADLNRALNAVLPQDVAVLSLSPASPGFHPRYDAVSRRYCYTLWNDPLRSPLLRRTALWVRRPLDLAAMDRAAQLLLGSQDFGTFGTAPRRTRHRGQGPGPTTVRRVLRAEWSTVDKRPAEPLPAWQQARLDGAPADAVPERGRSAGPGLPGARWQGLVEFTIEANAFLYRMVRSIVGTLIQVGCGDMTVAEFASALNGADRALAGPTAAPQGLCLIGVQYEEIK
jgi:tRNA pseudouridine38-40 synthase